MRNIAFTLALISSPLFAHDHSKAENAVTGYSVLWNSYEIGNHIAALLGLGHAHGHDHATSVYHFVEILGHTTNLFEGASHFIEQNTPHAIIPIVSLAFNAWAAHAQFSTIQARGWTALGVVLAPAGIADFFGHVTSAYVAISRIIPIPHN